MPHSEVPFPKDTAPRTYDVDALARFARILRFVHDAFETFAGRSFVRTSRVHLFWHSFDVAVTRFSGRRAPTFGEGERRSDVEAYSHEVVSFGFWPGDPQTRFPAFYSYAAPEPEGLTAHALAPAAAAWQELPSSHLALLAYDDVRTAPEPREALLAFLESAWQAGARAGKWPALEEEDTRPLWDALDAQFPLTRGRERR